MQEPVTRCPICRITVFQSSASTTPACTAHAAQYEREQKALDTPARPR